MTEQGLFGAIAEIAAKRPDANAISAVDGSRVTYGELRLLVGEMATELARRGIGPGDSIAARLESDAASVALILAVSKLGAMYFPLLSNFTAADVRMAGSIGHPSLCVSAWPDRIDGVETVDLADLHSSDRTHDLTASRHHDVFRMLWTSGSTGFPKAMTWRQDKFVRERLRWHAELGLHAEDTFLCRHPLGVAHATDLHVFSALLAGAEVVLASHEMSSAEFLRLLSAFDVSVVSALPDHYRDLVRAVVEGGAEVGDLRSLRYPLCGGSYLSPQVVRDAWDVLGIRIRQIYGSTEFGLAMWDAEGTGSDLLSPVAGVQCRIEPLSAADPDLGELVLVSDCTSEGYVANPEATDRTFRGPEFWTGDVAVRSTDGRFRILGRRGEELAGKDGPVIAPVLESAIEEIPGVAQSVVLPLFPGEYLNELLVAWTPDADALSGDDVEREIDRLLAGHHLDGQIRRFEAFPRSPVGKVDKPQLRSIMGQKTDTTSGSCFSEGQGPTIVFVPGLFATHASVRGIIAELAQNHRVVTVPLPGHGPPLSGAATIELAGAQLAESVAGEVDEPFVLMGWSMGATACWAYLDEFTPANVLGLISIEQTPKLVVDPDWPHGGFGQLDSSAVVGLAETAKDDLDSLAEQVVGACFTDATKFEQLHAQMLEQAKSCDPVAIADLLLDIGGQDWRDTLRGFDLPCLFQFGALSNVYPTPLADWAQSDLPDSTVQVFERSGHMPFVDERDAFVASVSTFVSRRFEEKAATC